ncbi:unnamed protein product, partial [Symbiodinium necroappetens]
MEAELLALAWAQCWALEFGPAYGVPIFFYYDSQSAGGGAFCSSRVPKLHLADGSSSLPEFVALLRQALSARLPVGHCHVKGHSGSLPNELADQLAKHARRHPEDIYDRCLPEWPSQWAAHPLRRWGWMAHHSSAQLPYLPAMEAEACRLQERVRTEVTPPTAGLKEINLRAIQVYYDLTFVSLNVLSMFTSDAPKGRKNRVPQAGLLVSGKKDLLREQFLRHKVWVAGLQETRLPTGAVLPDKDFYILNSAATDAGSYGCSLWLSLSIPYAHDGSRPLRLERSHVVVTSLSPRHIQVQIEELATRPAHSVHIVLTDSNSHVGSVQTDAVGCLDPEDENEAGELFHGFLLHNQLFAPSTFSTFHSGQSWTWIAARGDDARYRLDFVCVPQEWATFELKSKVWTDFEALQARDDHYPVVLTAVFGRLAPANKYTVHARVAQRPPRDLQWQQVQHFSVALGASGAPGWDVPVVSSTTRPRQPYLTPDTLALVHRRAAVRGEGRAFTPHALTLAQVSLQDLQHPKQLYQVVRKAFPQDGTLATTPQERADRWTAYFSAQEAGEVIPIADYAGHFRDSTLDPTPDGWVFDHQALPDLFELEQQILGLPFDKAAGPDGVTGELLRVQPALTSQWLYPLYLKTAMCLQEPTTWRGGALMCLAKRAAALFDCKAFRSILLSSVPSKLYHRILRNKLMGAFANVRGDLQAGQIPGLGVESISLVVRSYQAWARKTGHHSAAVFFDIKAAFYMVLRQALVPSKDSDAVLLRLLHGLGIPPSALEELFEQLSRAAYIVSAGAGPHLTALVTDLLRGTWFRLDGASALVLTQRGSRPGDPLADLLFAFTFSAYVRSAEQALQSADLQTYCPETAVSAPWCGWEPVRQVGIASWADDYVMLQVSREVGGLIARTRAATEVLVSQASSAGMEVSFARDKTAVLLSSDCTLADRGEVLRDPELGVCLLGSTHLLPIVDSYRHLGGILTANGVPAAEAPSPPLAVALMRGVLLQRLLKHGPSTLLHLLHVHWRTDPQHSWLGMFARDVQAVAVYCPAAQVVLDSSCSVTALVEAIQADATWWLRQVKCAIRQYGDDLEKWAGQTHSHSTVGSTTGDVEAPLPLVQGRPFQCRLCDASFVLRKHQALHACLKFYHTVDRLQYHLKRSAPCLTRVVHVLPPMSPAELRAVEGADAATKRKVGKGQWQHYVAARPSAQSYGPRLPIAAERLQGLQEDDLTLADLGRVYRPPPGVVAQVMDFIDAASSE